MCHDSHGIASSPGHQVTVSLDPPSRWSGRLLATQRHTVVRYQKTTCFFYLRKTEQIGGKKTHILLGQVGIMINHYKGSLLNNQNLNIMTYWNDHRSCIPLKKLAGLRCKKRSNFGSTGFVRTSAMRKKTWPESTTT